MRYFCCDERRREAVRATGVLNGIDFLEVVDSEATNAADAPPSATPAVATNRLH